MSSSNQKDNSSNPVMNVIGVIFILIAISTCQDKAERNPDDPSILIPNSLRTLLD